MAFTLHPDAEVELRGVLDYLDDKQAGLGSELLAEIEMALQRISENPKSYATEDELGVRYCPLGKFPYTLVYLDKEEYIWVVALAHQSRRPAYWKHRQPE